MFTDEQIEVMQAAYKVIQWRNRVGKRRKFKKTHENVLFFYKLEAAISKREFLILRRRFLNGKTRREVGNEFFVTDTRIKQIEKKVWKVIEAMAFLFDSGFARQRRFLDEN